jgi:GNAT superfamily N-acetyltransferase
MRIAHGATREYPPQGIRPSSVQSNTVTISPSDADTGHRPGESAYGPLPDYHVMLARPRDLPLLASIELAAARLLAGHAPSSVLNATTSQFELRKARRAGRLWVVLAGDEPVGFAHVVVHENGVAHLEEVDVHPDHGRRGLGRRLVQTVCAWATSHGFDAVTLTTYREPPWNMPFYARLGFEPLAPHAVSVALRSVIDDEMRRGLDPARRVAMRYQA